MVDIDVLKAQIVRQEVDQPWGFRLQGGADCGEPLKICRVVSGSPAARIGLKEGDNVIEINGMATFDWTHSRVLDAIGRHQGLTLWITVERMSKSPKSFTREMGNEETNYFPLSPTVYQTFDVIGSDALDQPTLQSMDDFVPSDDRMELAAGTGRDNVTIHSRVADDDQYPRSISAAAVDDRSSSKTHHQTINRSDTEYFPPGPKRTEFEFYTVKSRPFVEPVTQRRPKPSETSQSLTSQSTWPSYEQSNGLTNPEAYFEPTSPVSYKSEYSAHLHDFDPLDVPQSRTFRLLQSVMSNEEPAAGVSGLPPPRSAALERMKREGRSGSSPRIKVLVSQKYNSPLGMYSAPNVIETFAAQAESALETLEKQQPLLPEYQPVYSSTH